MVLATAGLQTHIWNNNLRSLLLLALYPFFIGLMVWVIAGLAAGMATMQPDTPFVYNAQGANDFILLYWPAIFTVVAIWFMVCWFFNTNMVRALSGSKPVTRAEEPELYNLLENLCISRGLKMPRLEIIETAERNAFASGINEKSYGITVTRGLMQALQKDELEAVLAHELTHIINRDVRLLIVSIIFTGMLGFAAQLFWRAVFRGLLYGRRSRGGGKGGSDARLLLVLFAIGIILWIGYMATIFTRFALSRRREFMADAGAVELTKNPEAMMRALQRIAADEHVPGMPGDVALMCIENSSKFMGLFATHPPLPARITAISEATGTPVPPTAA